MDDLVRAVLLNSGISLRAVSSLFNVMDSTCHSDSFSRHMSDTPNLDGRLDENSARAIAHFASKNLR